MLKKLLKYDFKALYRYWWIAAAFVMVLSVLGGGFINIFKSQRNLPTAVYAMSGIGIFIVILGFAALYIMAIVMVFSRFYKNFFTDEGYLTFTLPVKRSDLISSKLISGVTMIFSTGFVIAVGVILMMCIGFREYVFSAEFWEDFSDFFSQMINELGFYLVIYIVEYLVLILLVITLFLLMLYCCITIGSIITKKAKVITAVGIYYVVNSGISFVTQMITMFCVPQMVLMFSGMLENAQKAAASHVALTFIFFLGMLCALLYTLQYFMLDRKLNLN